MGTAGPGPRRASRVGVSRCVHDEDNGSTDLREAGIDRTGTEAAADTLTEHATAPEVVVVDGIFRPDVDRVNLLSVIEARHAHEVTP